MFQFSFNFATGWYIADSRRILNEEEVENLLIFLLNHNSVCVQAAAARAVAAVSENLVSRDTFGKLGRIVFVFCFLLLKII